MPEGFTIEGKEYEVPTVDTFDLSEARILKRYSGVVLEDFAPVHPDAPEAEREEWETKQRAMLSDPEFKAAFAHIAYRRGNPDSTFEAIDAIVEKLNLVEVTLALFEEEDADPTTDSPSELESESDSSPLLKQSDSGSPSPNGSDQPEKSLEPTGTTESDTSSPGVAPIALVS